MKLALTVTIADLSHALSDIAKRANPSRTDRRGPSRYRSTVSNEAHEAIFHEAGAEDDDRS